MSSATLRARVAGPTVRAPDEVPVRPFDLSPARHLALAEGLIEPGQAHRPHAHLTVEQVTYVLEGRVRVTSFDREAGTARSVELEAGQAAITVPGESLELACAGPATARVLFCTAPPYPANHADTVVLDRHRELDADERARASDRRGAVLASLREALSGR